MITHIKIQNFRSFVEAEVDLQPFSLVVGANGSGKTNLLRFFSCAINLTDLPKNFSDKPGRFVKDWQPHVSKTNEGCAFELNHGDVLFIRGDSVNAGKDFTIRWSLRPEGAAQIFNLIASRISRPEKIILNAVVAEDGTGTTAVLEMLKSGDRDDLFDRIEEQFRLYVPEVEKLSLKTSGEGTKQIQVREKALPIPLPATELSEGTRIILAILTIIHQEKPPSMILLEDIDRGLHPRLFEYLAPLLRDIAIKHDINIVATTHNPYLVDAMQDHKEAVIIVEKKDGASTLSTLASRLEGLDYDKVDPDDLPLGQLWFSGLVGGVPKSLSSRPAK
ncbi:MAG: AAA family ATPase [Verrucomicrobiota bacterium]